MQVTDRVLGVRALGLLVQMLHAAGVDSRAAWAVWAKSNTGRLESIFAYPARPGMPPIHALVRPAFHPDANLVMFNYTGAAHNTLHAFPDGWTNALRLCRGIVFERETGKLVAFPLPKFFNDGEHAETTELPDEPWEASTKEDGHLGIIFAYEGKLYITTRGDFESATAKLATKMLHRYARENKWSANWFAPETHHVEIIHPQTRVHVEYDGAEEFVLLNSVDLARLEEPTHAELLGTGMVLGLRVAEAWHGRSLADLRAQMQDDTVRNREGWVVRFPQSGLRVKLKYKTYIGLMVADKLSYRYLMARMVSGNLASMVLTLDHEIRSEAERMVGRLVLVRDLGNRVADAKKRQKMRRSYLHGLVPPEECTDYYKDVCRRYLRWLDAA